MPIKLNPSETYAVKILIQLTTLYSLIITAIVGLSTNHVYGIIASVVFVISMAIISFLGQDKIFGHILLNIMPSTKKIKGISDGTWQIVITFKDGENGDIETKRSGSLQFTNSFIGMKVKGGKLVDHETEEIERTGWFSEEAEILEYKGKKILKYIYKIYGKTDRDSIEKVGVVVATKDEEEDKFSGIFHDISLADNQILRSGTVVLYPTLNS